MPAPRAAEATFHWMLPKTVVDVTASYEFKNCVVEMGRPKLTLEITTSVVPRAIPADLGKNFPHQQVEVPVKQMISFWRNNTVSVKTYPNGLLQALGAKSSDQTGTIVGNVFTTITKVAGIAVGAPTALGLDAGRNRPDCGEALKTTLTIKKLQAQLLTTSKPHEQTGIAAQIQALRKTITVEEKRTIDPGVSPVEEGENKAALITDTNPIAQIKPSEKKVEKAKWYNDEGRQLAFSKDAPPPNWILNLYLNVPSTYPKELKPLPADALYRDTPLCLVEMYLGAKTGVVDADAENLKFHEFFGFGQFGIPQKLPMRAGLFETFEWSVTFLQDGTTASADFTTTAKGIAASALLSNAATAASGVDATLLKAAAGDSDTAKLTAQNTALKAEIDNINYIAQLETLKAAQEAAEDQAATQAASP